MTGIRTDMNRRPARGWRDGRLATRLSLLAMVLMGVVLTSGLAGTAAAGEAGAKSVTNATHPRLKTRMKRDWGIEVLFVRETSAGYMLEFRYKVLDPERAAPLFERQAKPILTHVETGAQMIVPTPPKTGALRNSNLPKANHTYWMFFANPGKFVKPGDEIRIEIGEFVANGLIVQQG